MEIKKFLEWRELSKKLKRLKEEEANLRVELCSSIFNAYGEYKTTVVELDGYEVKAVAKINTKIDEAVFNSIYNKLSPEELNVVKLKPTLDKRKYNKLPDREVLDLAIIETPGRPTLSVKEIL